MIAVRERRPSMASWKARCLPPPRPYSPTPRRRATRSSRAISGGCSSSKQGGGAAHPSRRPTITDEFERYYSPGRTWQSLAAGIAGFLELGDVLDAGAGDGAAAAALAPYCKSLRCIDINQRQIDVARSRFAKLSHVKVQVADVHAMPFDAASFDGVLLFHTLTHATDPPRVLRECSRVLRPGGRLVILCLDRHEQRELTARYGEIHPGFAPRDLRRLLTAAELEVKRAQVAAREDKKTRLDVVLAVAQKPINTQS